MSSSKQSITMEDVSATHPYSSTDDDQLSKFVKAVSQIREDTGIDPLNPRPVNHYNENCKTPQDLMLYSMMEMLKHILYRLAKDEEDVRQYATWELIFEAALTLRNREKIIK